MYVWGKLPYMDSIEFDKVETMTPDDRGRVYLGPEFANTDVKVCVERVDDGE